MRSGPWRISRTFVFVLILSGCATGGSGPTSRPAAVRNQIEGIENFARVSPDLYRGAQPTREGFVELKELGVRTVISLRGSDADSAKLRGLGIRYVNIPCSAWAMDDREVAEFLKIVADPANRPVFVHCHRGADRTGCAVAAYRIVENGWAVDEAIREMRSFGHFGLYAQLRQYLRKMDIPGMRQRISVDLPVRNSVVQ